MPRIARSVAVDYPHHVMQRGNNRATVFFDDDGEEVEKTIRQRTSCGRPLGGDVFIYLLECRYGHRLKIGKKGRPRKETAEK